MRFMVPLVAALVALIITPGWLAHFDVTPKVAILLFGLLLILLYRSANVHNFHKLVGHKEGRWLAAALFAQWLTWVLATALSSHFALSLNGSGWRRCGLVSETGLLLFALTAAAWLAGGRDNTRRLIRAATTTCAAASLYGISQYFGWDPLLPAKAYQVGEGQFTIVRPPGTLGHADYFAAWLVVVVFLALACARLETGWTRNAALASALLGVAAIGLNGTRAALLGLAAGAAVYLFASGARFRGRAMLVGAACLTGLVTFFFSPAGTKLRARLHWAMEDVRGGSRLMLWRDSVTMAEHRPIWGYGPETFTTEFSRFESVDLARAYPDFYSESPHNMFLDALTSVGALGLLALVAVCGLGLWAASRALRARTPLAAPLTAALAGLLVSHQFAVFVFANAFYFYLLIALLIVEVMSDTTTTMPMDPTYPRISVHAALGVSLLLTSYAVRLLMADAALAAAQRDIAAGDASSAERAYAGVLRWQLPGAGSDLDYSRMMQQLLLRSPIPATRLEAHQQALEAGIRAVSTAEDPQNAWYNLSMLLARENDTPGVEHALRNAIAWAPNWFKPHWTLAKLLDLTGHRAEALKEARIAAALNGSHDAEVRETLDKLEHATSTEH